MAFFKTSRAESNEVVKAEDITFNFDSQVSNFSVLLQSLIDPTSNFVVGGKVSVLSGMNLNIDPILGCAKDTGICFVSTEKLTEGVAVSASESQDRIDIVQIKAIEEDYDEQQRSFIDFETKIETIQNVFTKKRVILQVEVKKGSAGSVISPTTDFGFVKLAEIFVPANSTSIDEWNIYNITSNYKGEENENWTNEKDITYNFQYLSEINKELQNEHNKDGSHKQKVIGSAELDYGVGSNQVNTSILPLGTSISVDNNQLSASTTTTIFLSLLAEKISTIFKDYYNKGGVYNFNGEIKISDVFENNALTKALKIKCDGNGSAFFYVNEKLIFTITESGKFIMPSGYSALASNEIVTKSVTDAILEQVSLINEEIEKIKQTESGNTDFINDLFSRFSFSNQEITAATTENIELYGKQTIDNIPLEIGNIVLVKNQENAIENGIYEVQTGIWNRLTGFDNFSSFKNKFFTIANGTVNKGKVFFTPQESCIIGTNVITFHQSFFENLETKQTVPIRDSNGNIKTGMPLEDNNATNKKYVDTFVQDIKNEDTAISVIKGDGTSQTIEKYIHPTTPGNIHIPSGGSSGQFLSWKQDGMAEWANVDVPPRVSLPTPKTGKSTTSKTHTITNSTTPTNWVYNINFSETEITIKNTSSYIVHLSTGKTSSSNVNMVETPTFYYLGVPITYANIPTSAQYYMIPPGKTITVELPSNSSSYVNINLCYWVQKGIVW